MWRQNPRPVAVIDRLNNNRFTGRTGIGIADKYSCTDFGIPTRNLRLVADLNRRWHRGCGVTACTLCNSNQPGSCDARPGAHERRKISACSSDDCCDLCAFGKYQFRWNRLRGRVVNQNLRRGAAFAGIKAVFAFRKIGKKALNSDGFTIGELDYQVVANPLPRYDIAFACVDGYVLRKLLAQFDIGILNL